MAANPWVPPEPPTMAMRLNQRILEADPPKQVESPGHLTVTADGESQWGEPPSTGVTHVPIELSYDNPDVVIDWNDPNLALPDWAKGLTNQERQWVLSLSSVGGVRDAYADRLRAYHLRTGTVEPKDFGESPPLPPLQAPRSARSTKERPKVKPLVPVVPVVLSDQTMRKVKPLGDPYRHKDRSKGWYLRKRFLPDHLFDRDKREQEAEEATT